MIYVWFGGILLFLLMEAATVGLVSIWFALGSLGALVAAALGAGIPLQVVVFLILTAASLAALRPLTRKYLKPRITATNVDAVVGKEALVTEEIHNLQATGAVKLSGVVWTARATNDQIIPVDTVVKVDRVEGVKVYVTPLRTPSGKA